MAWGGGGDGCWVGGGGTPLPIRVTNTHNDLFSSSVGSPGLGWLTRARLAQRTATQEAVVRWVVTHSVAGECSSRVMALLENAVLGEECSFQFSMHKNAICRSRYRRIQFLVHREGNTVISA